MNIKKLWLCVCALKLLVILTSISFGYISLPSWSAGYQHYFDQTQLSVLDKYINFRHDPSGVNTSELSVTARKRLLKPLRVFELFDWVIWDDDAHTKLRKYPPRTILVHSGSASRFKEYRGRMLGLPEVNKNNTRSIVFAGEDTSMSRFWLRHVIVPLHMLHKISYFWFEGKDAEVPKEFLAEGLRVRAVPMGLDASYILRCGEDAVARAIAASDRVRKTQPVCAAWGAVHPRLDRILPHRAELAAFIANNSNWLSRSHWNAEEYWFKLSKCNFLIVPPGQGVQTPKLAESWLVQTVPISLNLPAFRDLRDMGFPMVLVDSWSEISPDNVTKWRRDIADSSVDWSNVRRMLTHESIMKLIRGD
mmetsp:Transcript_21677/g.31545  ORF Transcript_21677/g.31545 Transcript_21677/m.31545 type:complete len:363 (-) Transcript_21677:150-1238(-)